MAHVSKEKKKIVKEFTELLNKYPIIGAVNMENLPAKQLQNMRSQLRSTLEMKMTKRNLIKIAIDECNKPDLEALKDQLKGMPALIFTKENPFTLFKFIKKNKSTAPIKAGQTAPNDILVPAGPTSFAPGPVIGELGAFKIKTGIEDGKIVIKEDAIVAKEGEVVDGKLAGLLTRLGVEPMQIGLDLVAVYENGEIIPKSVLDIDEEAYMNNLKFAALESLNIAMFVAYPTKETTNLLLAKAHTDAKAIAESQNILTDETAGKLLGKAENQMQALKSKLNIKVPEPKAEEVKKEEKPSEPETTAEPAPAANALRNQEVSGALETQSVSNEPEAKAQEEQKPVEVKEESKEEPKVEEVKEKSNEPVTAAPEKSAEKEKTEKELKEEVIEATKPSVQVQVTEEDMKVAEAKLKELHKQRMAGMKFEGEEKKEEKIPTAHELAEKKAQKEENKKKEEIEKAKKG